MDGTLAIVSNADSPSAQLCISRSTLLTAAGAEVASGDKVSVTTGNASDAGDTTGGGMGTAVWHCGAANVGIDCCGVYTYVAYVAEQVRVQSVSDCSISGGGAFSSSLSSLFAHHEQIKSKPTVPAKILAARRNQIKLIFRFELQLILSLYKILK
ncbi:hypothetical protein T07_8008 [Trichinella nelsoni]|uniref:Uncharacterized protein n=1 Tax=Trichinella nelsoni TaxID=6336 RepID=A0A0V0S9U9_9BILA|nr:hypothetical protein T07_8008 [Trichinella nelsoni]